MTQTFIVPEVGINPPTAPNPVGCAGRASVDLRRFSLRKVDVNGVVTFAQSDGKVRLKLPVEKHDALDTILVLECATDVGP